MLTDTQARNAKPADRPYKLTDAGGLHLYVTPAGGRWSPSSACRAVETRK